MGELLAASLLGGLCAGLLTSWVEGRARSRERPGVMDGVVSVGLPREEILPLVSRGRGQGVSVVGSDSVPLLKGKAHVVLELSGGLRGESTLWLWLEPEIAGRYVARGEFWVEVNVGPSVQWWRFGQPHAHFNRAGFELLEARPASTESPLPPDALWLLGARPRSRS